MMWWLFLLAAWYLLGIIGTVMAMRIFIDVRVRDLWIIPISALMGPLMFIPVIPPGIGDHIILKKQSPK